MPHGEIWLIDFGVPVGSLPSKIRPAVVMQNDLLFDKLPDYMSEKQKLNKIGNILGYLRNQNFILNTGSDRQPIWKLRVNYE